MIYFKNLKYIKIYDKIIIMSRCINCNKIGHMSRTCNFPITSFGFICINIDNESNVKYLMVQRSHSFSYVEFLRSKYDLRHKNYILKLFSNMTELERDNIKNNDFSTLWANLWNTRNKNETYSREYKESLKKFNYIKNGYIIVNKDGSIKMDIDYILNNTVSELYEPEFGFPKGRRNYNEMDFECAKREFYEETGFNPRWLYLLSDKPYEEIFTGMNNKRYKNVYYFAIMNNRYTKLNKLKNYSEISNVCWFDYNETQEHIKLINIERKELLKRIHIKILKNIFRYKVYNE